MRFELTHGRYMAFPVLPLNYILKIENNCWPSDDIESSLIGCSISTNKEEYDLFLRKVKEIGTTVHGFCYRGLWRTYRVEPVKQTDKLERSEPITRPASDWNASMLIVQLHQLRIKRTKLVPR